MNQKKREFTGIDGIVYTDIRDMGGYRPPTGEEQLNMGCYMQVKTRKENRMLTFWSVFSALVCVIAFLTLLGSEDGTALKVVVFDAVVALVGASAFFGCRGEIRKNKKLLEYTRNGQFRMMPCVAVEADPAGGATGSPGGCVQLQNNCGQICSKRMPVDSASCKEWRVNPGIPFWIMRVDYGEKEPYFEAFSKKKYNLI